MPSASPEIDLPGILQQKFGLLEFRRGQRDILTSVLANRDTLAVMPTGGGKSLCYQLPAVARPGLVLVISPLISLMQDQVRLLQTLHIPAACLHTGQKVDEKRKIFSKVAQHENFLLFLSPERVQKPGFAPWLKRQKISLIAIDEAHCISQWGPDFREDYHRLKILRELRPDVPILALTATATPQVLVDIGVQLGLQQPDKHVYGFYRPNLYYQVEACENTATKNAFLFSALHQITNGRVLIYCGTRRQAEDIALALQKKFTGVGFYHAGLSTGERQKIQRDYDAGDLRILLATNAFGMGIDHPDVRLVIHYQMPANIESLYQEMGRAGRDTLPSTCLLLYAKKDKGLHSFFIQQSDASETIIRRRWRSLETIVEFAEGGECRHAGILTYFRDTQRIEACGHCDICDPGSSRCIARPKFEDLISPSQMRKMKKSKARANDDRPLTKEEEVRAEILRTWRKAYAKENDVPAFVVFSNKTLHDLARKAPRTLDQLEKVHGFGPHKIEHLGAHILRELRHVAT